MTTAREAALTALLDQADAADRHAAGIMARFAEMLTDPRYTLAGPVTHKLLGRMHGRMLGRSMAGEPTLCDHLSYTAPEPAFWAAWKPGRLRCAQCIGRVGERIRGTAEDYRCDGCRRPAGSTIVKCSLHIPPVILDAPPLPLAGLPPIIVVLGLCGRCMAKDGQSSHTIEETRRCHRPWRYPAIARSDAAVRRLTEVTVELTKAVDTLRRAREDDERPGR
jgi:hypothetical protein